MGIGGYNREIARFIYINARKLVNAMIKSGKIAANNADKEWAKLVAKELRRVGAKVPEKILKMIK